MKESPDNALIQFEHELRRSWHDNQWYYAIIDVIGLLTQSRNPSSYWSTLKQRLSTEGGGDTLTNIVALKLPGKDNRLRLTDTASRRTLLRLMQSIPSPYAEPFKQWLATVGDERIAEVENPELLVERMRATYRSKGYDDAWIEQRLRTDMTRNELTDEWKARGAKEGQQFALLTNEMSKGTFGLSVRAHKDYKLLPAKANLRDHMTTLEMALISLGEATATELHRTRTSEGFNALHQDSHDAGVVAGNARRDVEAVTGRSAISSGNHLAQLQEAQRAKMTSLDTEVPTQQLLFDEPKEE